MGKNLDILQQILQTPPAAQGCGEEARIADRPPRVERVAEGTGWSDQESATGWWFHLIVEPSVKCLVDGKTATAS